MKRLLSHIHKTVKIPGSSAKLVEDIDLYEEKPTPTSVKILRVVGVILAVTILVLIGMRIAKSLNKFPTPKPVSAVYYFN